MEEYRRPSFEITFDPIRRPYRTGDTVHVTGSVTAYSGVSVQDLPLAYTVTAQERWVWRNSRGGNGIAADTVRLDRSRRTATAVRCIPWRHASPMPEARHSRQQWTLRQGGRHTSSVPKA